MPRLHSRFSSHAYRFALVFLARAVVETPAGATSTAPGEPGGQLARKAAGIEAPLRSKLRPVPADPMPLVVSPISHTFPSTPVGSTSAPETSTVKESNGISTSINGINESCASFSREVDLVTVVDGEAVQEPASFPVAVYRFIDIETGTVSEGFLEVRMHFTPVAAGPAPGCTVTVDRATGTDPTIGLGGTGLAPVMTTSPGNLTFADQPVGAVSAPQEVTVANVPGNLPLGYTASVQGDHAADFQITCASPPCFPASVPGTESEIFLVRFSPTANGERTAEIVVSGDDPANAEDTIPISGAGIPNPVFGDDFESSDTSAWNGGCVACLP